MALIDEQWLASLKKGDSWMTYLQGAIVPCVVTRGTWRWIEVEVDGFRSKYRREGGAELSMNPLTRIPTPATDEQRETALRYRLLCDIGSVTMHKVPTSVLQAVALLLGART